jgi:phage-related holin
VHGLTQAFETKAFLGGIVLLLSYISQSIDEVFVILAVFIVLDYITGVLCGMLRALSILLNFYGGKEY